MALSEGVQDDSQSPRELHLLTLNCWGLLHLSALREERLPEIGKHLAQLQPLPDIVCLQECWTQRDYLAVALATSAVLPYAKFYHGGAFGAGLAILSRWPIEESSMFRYPLNGRPTAFFRGDWFVGKGIACARIRIGPAKDDVVEVFNTHTHAPYEKEPNDSYICHRTAQAWEMSKLLRGASSRGHLALALGDFNMLPLSLAHRLITTHAPVRDVWRVLHPASSLGPSHHPSEKARRRPVPSAEFNLKENGATSNNVSNTWRWTKSQQKRARAGEECSIAPDTPDPRGKRLDYIFASTGNTGASGSIWLVSDASVALTERHPVLGVSLSDHFAVRATLHRHGPSKLSAEHRSSTSDTSALRSGTYLAPDSPSTSSLGLSEPEDFDTQLMFSYEQDATLPLSVYEEILLMAQKYTTRETKQQFWRGIHFYASLLIWIGCLTAVWFSPGNFVAFILMFVGSLNLVAGVIDGLLALLFFSTELRTLKEFEWEIQNARDHVSGDITAPEAHDLSSKAP